MEVELDMTEYLDTWRKSPQDRGMMVNRPKTLFMDLTFEQNEQETRAPVNVTEVTGQNYSFQIPRDEWGCGGNRLVK